jgi:hypothetical protein
MTIPELKRTIDPRVAHTCPPLANVGNTNVGNKGFALV